MTPVVVAGGSSLSRHGTHIAAVAIPLFMVVVALTWDSVHTRRRRRLAEGRPRRSARDEARVLRAEAGTALHVAAVACVGAAAVHLRVLPDHAAESAWYGAFFAAAALGQLVAAGILVVRPSRRFAALSGAGSAAVIGLWLATRLVTIPLGPAAGRVESFGALDVLASGLETIVVLACASALWMRRAPRRFRTWQWDAVTIPAITLATVAVFATARVG